MRSTFNIGTTAALVVTVAYVAGVVRAGSITYRAFNDDASSQISSANTYTHAVDAGDTTGVVINGVTFQPMTAFGGPSTSGAGITYSLTSNNALVPFSSTTGAAWDASGQVVSLLSDFVYGGAGGVGGLITLPAESLTPGTPYRLSLYCRRYGIGDPRNVNIHFDEDGGGPLAAATGSMNEDAPTTISGAGLTSDNSPYIISYDYVATSSAMGVGIEMLQSGYTFHFYGLTNQVLPEPVSLLPLATLLAAFGPDRVLRRRNQPN